MGGDSYVGLLMSMIFLSCVIAFSSLFGIRFSTKYGRRQMMLYTCIPMGLALLLLNFALYLNMTSNGESKAAGWLCVIALSLYLHIFCLGFNTNPWLVQTEIFPVSFNGG